MLEREDLGEGKALIAGSSKREREIRRLATGALLALALACAEAIGGHLAGSSVLLADSAHMLSDVLALAVCACAARAAQRKDAAALAFGHAPVETLGSLVTLALTWTLATTVLVHGIRRALAPPERFLQPEGPTIAAVALLAAISNGAILVTLGGICTHSHSYLHSSEHACEHSHGGVHDHGHVHSGSVNLRAASVHILGDLAQSLLICVAGVAIWANPSLRLLDPLASIAAACFIFASTAPVTLTTLDRLMLRAPRHLDLPAVLRSLHKLDGVHTVRSARLWDASSTIRVFMARVVLHDDADQQHVLHSQMLPYARLRLGANECCVQCERE